MTLRDPNPVFKVTHGILEVECLKNFRKASSLKSSYIVHWVSEVNVSEIISFTSPSYAIWQKLCSWILNMLKLAYFQNIAGPISQTLWASRAI